MAGSGDVERRIVTVLFADVVGFTTLSERLDAEDVATVQDAYFAQVRSVLGRHGGTLEKFIGDAAMAVFGVPTTRDDDAERAVRAGVALTAAVERVGAEVGLGPDDLRLRVGINTGEVAYVSAGPDAGRISGDTVNVAARLQTAAPTGGVLVGPATAMAVSAVAELSDGGSLQLKGKTTEVAAFRVTGLRGEPSRERAMGELRAPLIGRETELAALRTAVAGIRTGAARWLILAPPGAGKTRLLATLAASVDDRLLRARVRPEVVNPDEVLRDLLWTALGHPPDPTAELRTALNAGGIPALRAEVVAGEVSAALGAAPSPPSTDRDARFGAWLDAFDALDLVAGRPAVWLVEDVHWAGGDVLAFLDLASRRPGPHGRLVVTSARPALLAAAPNWCAGARQLPLEPLPMTDTARLVQALIGEVLPADLMQAVTERADGNPLFVEELLRTWISTGTLVRQQTGGWRLDRAPDQVELPATVRVIYAAQLDDLPPDARRLARHASVAGRRFPAAALPALDVPDGAAAAAVLLRRGLLTGPHPDLTAGDGYAFRHALLRDAGYASLARADRARLHVRLARWLEATPGAAEPIGRHYAAAAEAAPALGGDIADGIGVAQVRTLAGDWLERAAEVASGSAAPDTARDLLSRALEVDPDAPGQVRARRLLALGEITAHTTDMTAGADLLAQACAEYESAHDDEGYAAATAALATVRYEQLAFDDGAALAAAALRRIGERDDLATARLLAAHGQCVLGGTDDAPAAEAELTRALALAERYGDARLGLTLLDQLARASPDVGAPAVARWEQIETLARSLRDWRTVAASVTNQAMVLLGDDLPAARARIDPAAEVCVAYGLTEEAAWVDYLRTEAGFLDGDWDGAVAAGRRAIEVAASRGFDRIQIRTWFTLAPIAAARSDGALFERLHAWTSQLGPLPDSPYARVMLAGLRLYLADAGFGEPVAPDVAPLLPGFDIYPLSRGSWVAAVERLVAAWLAAGQRAEVREVIDRSAAARQPDHDRLLAPVAESLLRSRLKHAEGDVDMAQLLARSAADVAARNGLPWWRLQALHLLGQDEPDLARRLGVRYRATPAVG
jgi:class 3 adenylate cyclase